ncbi:MULTISPECIES: 3-hydroxyacyl-CoA dehydrogenase/enoyl-CoA hydratase family protein [Acidobacterium]|uniref:Fatty oxidation complex, alpha subunit n=1 Tax=Acidobacterium capsulatum (strain ATCC 51196 / DSM 11244 / BCRC 80197 / JCM 7670 / NBRC 15755 / NCIMB 13165 / 161) TaxID=240015 RepID=C1F420_ACIC5|nr:MULTISPECIES: 3-hydroxyacyl-CoA dehydrogenase/enoyl-CoA hydratase family protein [Acidobacterium]ACO34593.1 fatty oxidation complex, alpha subunit [Acidobacterium capsulatum ATCC 51196]
MTMPASAASSSAPACAPELLLRRAAVLGAGTMGSRIAAHLANAGVPVLLLDRATPEGLRSHLAEAALTALKKAKPAAFFTPEQATLIETGNFEDDLAKLKDCDWVIEAVTEDLGIKQTLLASIAPHLHGDALVTTNTSGLPVHSIAAAMPEEFRRRWFGTHFFNPPRYMRLVEVIATPEADAARVAALAEWVDRRLGKQVVMARDTPNFIANRIGVFAMLHAVRLMQAQQLTIEEVDALTGAAIGWPRTGTFRLADLVGIDVLAHVARNFAASRAEEDVKLPDFVNTMLGRGWLGDKAGQGFYKRDKAATDPKNNRLVLDYHTLEYQPARRPKFPSVEMAKSAPTAAELLRAVLEGDPAKDRAAGFLWPLLTGIWNYAANCLPEIADSPASIDQAMRAGFNWELGPFEMWDAVGVARVCERMQAAGQAVSAQAEALLSSGETAWYRDGGEEVFDPVAKRETAVARPAGYASAASLRRAHGVVRQNAGCSLIDMGEGIGLLALHSPKNAIGGDIVSLVTQTLAPEGEWVRQFRGFVIAGDRSDFAVGANLLQLLLAMQEGDWDEVDLAIRAFQGMTSAIKLCPRPVVAAPYGMCLGGGAEICLHAAARQPHAELYLGLVEMGVGLIPGGGGSKEMALRAFDAARLAASVSPAEAPGRFALTGEYQDAVRTRFETVGLTRVSTSAEEARALGFLSAADRVTMNRERLLLEARAVAVELAEAGYSAPVERVIPAPGDAALANLKLGIHLMRRAEYISDHDALVATKLARILCGGEVTPGVAVSERYLLEMEREAFLSLCGERKTQERIAYTLQTGKPLRN